MCNKKDRDGNIRGGMGIFEKMRGDSSILYRRDLGINIAEHVSELFDHATDLISDRSLVYGGAVRDCLSNIPIEGDLDVSVPYSDFRDVAAAFMHDPRWVRYKDGGNKASSSEIAKRMSPIDDIYSFVTNNGRIVQLICSDTSGDPLKVVRACDFICCGAVMHPGGDVVEILSGALSDCKEKVLRLNPLIKVTDISILRERIDKMVKRGWRNLIDIDAVEKAAHSAKRKADRRNRRSTATKPVSSIEQLTVRPVSTELYRYIDELSKVSNRVSPKPHIKMGSSPAKPFSSYTESAIRKVGRVEGTLHSGGVDYSYGSTSFKRGSTIIRGESVYSGADHFMEARHDQIFVNNTDKAASMVDAVSPLSKIERLSEPTIEFDEGVNEVPLEQKRYTTYSGLTQKITIAE